MGLLIDQRNAVRGGSEFFRLKARNVVRRENVFSCSRHELAVHGSSMFSVVRSEIPRIGGKYGFRHRPRNILHRGKCGFHSFLLVFDTKTKGTPDQGHNTSTFKCGCAMPAYDIDFWGYQSSSQTRSHWGQFGDIYKRTHYSTLALHWNPA